MEINEQIKILGLLGRAYRAGLRISGKDGQLDISQSERNEGAQSLIIQLEKNRDSLLSYLSSLEGENPEMESILNARTDAVLIEGELFYIILPHHQHHWWVDESIDILFKSSAFSIDKYKIKGKLNLSAAQAALSYVIKRHEIMRSTFHKINGNYYMKINDYRDSKYNAEIQEFNESLPNDHEIYENYVNYSSHQLDLSLGPLFLVRIARFSDSDFTISIKCHRSILDGWSSDVLKRDLISSYMSFSKGTIPELPVLTWQFKDYAYYHYRIREMYETKDRRYWTTAFPVPPPRLTFKGEIPINPLAPKIAAIRRYLLQKEATLYLGMLAKKYHTTVFVILQSFFKKYLQKTCGINDLVIGTIFFNRERSLDLVNQIGSYAKTCLIRTLIIDDASLAEMIRIVKKSNEDARLYSHCSLLEKLLDDVPQGTPINGTYWKVNLYYQEESGYGIQSIGNAEYDLKVDKIADAIKPILLNINMEIRFVNKKDTISMKVSYDKNEFEAEFIEGFVLGFLTFITELMPQFISKLDWI